MATKLYGRLTDVRGMPAAGQPGPVRVNIPIQGRLLNIKGRVTQAGVPATLATMLTAIGEVRFILGTEVVRKWRFSEIVSVMLANGYTVDDGLFPIFFAEPWRATVLDEELLSLQMAGFYDTVALEFDLVQPTVPLAFNFPYEYTLIAKTYPKDHPQAGQLARGILGHRIQVENVGGGEPLIVLNPFEGALQRIWAVIPSTVDITRARLVQGLTTFYDRYNTPGAPEIADSLKDMGMSIPPNFTDATGTFKMVPIIPDNNQRISNSISDTTGLSLQLNLSGPAALRILMEHQIQR